MRCLLERGLGLDPFPTPALQSSILMPLGSRVAIGKWITGIRNVPRCCQLARISSVPRQKILQWENVDSELSFVSSLLPRKRQESFHVCIMLVFRERLLRFDRQVVAFPGVGWCPCWAAVGGADQHRALTHYLQCSGRSGRQPHYLLMPLEE